MRTLHTTSLHPLLILLPLILAIHTQIQSKNPSIPPSPEIEEPHSPGIPETTPDHSEISPPPSSPEIEPQTPGPEINPGSNPPQEFELPPGESGDFAAMPSFSMDSPSSPISSTPEPTPSPRVAPPPAFR